jgi:hypothetical protein
VTLVAFAARFAREYHLSSIKLNAEQANQLLKHMKSLVEKQRADYLSRNYQIALGHDNYLKQLAERIQPNQ